VPSPSVAITVVTAVVPSPRVTAAVSPPPLEVITGSMLEGLRYCENAPVSPQNVPELRPPLRPPISPFMEFSWVMVTTT